MKKIHLTKGMISTVDDDDYERLMERSWQYGGGGYAVAKVFAKVFKKHNLLREGVEI